MQACRRYWTWLSGLAGLAVVLLVLLPRFHRSAGTEMSRADEFSAAHAYGHLRELSQRPHPTGSAEHLRVRSYLVSALRQFQVEAEVQEEAVFARPLAYPLPGAVVHNVIGRIRGQRPGGAVALVAHYDTVPTAPGAGDDGAAVAILLEAARALTSGKPLAGDVILLFTDAEELGLLGSRAFTQRHRWARELKVAINLEGRGAGGPVYMFQLGVAEDWLIQQLQRSSCRPVVSSVAGLVYRMMDNLTDLTELIDAQITGYDLAFIGDAERYHATGDALANFDMASLRQQGSCALALVRQLAAQELHDMAPTRSRPVIYFSLGSWLVSYSVPWALAALAAGGAAFFLLLFFAMQRKKITAGGLIIGALAVPLGLCAAAGGVGLVWWLLCLLRPEYEAPVEEIPGAIWYLLGFHSFAAAVLPALFARLRQRWRPEALAFGALAWTVLAQLVTIVWAREASYLFAWTLLGGLVALALLLRLDPRPLSSFSRGEWGALGLAIAPTILACAPVLAGAQVAMTTRMAVLTLHRFNGHPKPSSHELRYEGCSCKN